MYRLDESPSPRGYHYAFFGNAFFINEQGYLLTDAHVLETFRDGGQAFLIVRRPSSPPRLLQAAIVVTDPEHDIAVLRSCPLHRSRHPRPPNNRPFAPSQSPSRRPKPGSPARRPPPGQIISYESTQPEKSAPAAKIFLLSHPVIRGQSGSPVLALDSQAAVAIIEGRWLRSVSAAAAKSPSQAASMPGAATPIEYAIALLQRHGIAWHKSPK